MVLVEKAMSKPEIITVCAWCLQNRKIRVLKCALHNPRRYVKFILAPDGRLAQASIVVGGVERQLRISHGICPEHAAQLQAESSTIH